MEESHQSYNERISQSRSFIMGVAMLSIMLFHQRFINPAEYRFMMPFSNFGHLAVDVFFFLSGFGIVSSLKKNSLKTFYTRRALRLMPPCLFAGIIKSAWTLFINGRSISWMTLCSLDLWFIPALIMFYIISPMLFSAVKKFCSHALLICLAGSAIIAMVNYYIVEKVFCIDDIWSLPYTFFIWPFWRFPSYAVGMVIATAKLIWFTSSPRRMYIISIICFLGILALVSVDKLYGLPNPLGIRSMITFYLFIPGIPAIVDVLDRINFSIPSVFQKYISFIGLMSLELYLVHEFVFISLWSNWGSGWLQLTIAFVSSFILAFSLKNISSRISAVFSKSDLPNPL